MENHNATTQSVFGQNDFNGYNYDDYFDVSNFGD